MPIPVLRWCPCVAHPYEVCTYPVPLVGGLVWSEHKPHFSLGCAGSYHIDGGFRDGGARARAMCELGLFLGSMTVCDIPYVELGPRHGSSGHKLLPLPLCEVSLAMAARGEQFKLKVSNYRFKVVLNPES